MRPLIALLPLLLACEEPSTSTETPDLTAYALQADLDAALVEIDELREALATATPQVMTGACDDSTNTTSIELAVAVRVLSVRMCQLDNEGTTSETTSCSYTAYGVITPTGPELGYAQRIELTCADSYTDYELVYTTL